ncbi:MAG: hypothetical protein R6X19_10590 [Kiritimatiellia bacterium]
MMKKSFALLLVAACCLPARAEELLPNGGFEKADAANAAKPAGWDRPDGLGVQWLAEARGSNHLIRMNTAIPEKDFVASCKAAGLEKWVFPNPGNDPMAAAYGLSFHSDSLPVTTGQAYRLRFRYRGAGGAKVWVRGYGLLRGEERRRYDTVVNCRTPGTNWTEFSQCFHPTRRTPGVTSLRIMLYAYWPPGVYEFDDVTLAPVSDEEWERDHRENE